KNFIKIVKEVSDAFAGLFLFISLFTQKNLGKTYDGQYGRKARKWNNKKSYKF
ncbi:conserved hypothetical protein, partial [Listeria ivanovii FSL F6-596]